MIITKLTATLCLGALVLVDFMIASAFAAHNGDLLMLGASLVRWPLALSIYAIPLAFVADLARAVAGRLGGPRG